MRYDTAAQELIDALEHVEDTSQTDPILVEAAAEILRVLNIDAQDFIEDICQPAFKDYTMDFLADVANTHRVKVETELYAQVNELFYQVRNGTADLDAFFNTVLGKNL
jgi:hypothetical protein